MPKSNSPPLDAVLLPDSKPRRSWVPFIMGGMLISSGILAVVLGFWGLFRLIEQNAPGSMSFSGTADKWPSRVQKQAEYRAIYKIPADVVVDPDLAQVDKLLAKYVAAVKYGDQGGLARLVDVDAFLHRMDEHPDMPRLDAVSRRALKDMLNRELQLPGNISDCRLMGFKRVGSTGAAVADVILKYSTGSSDPCRIWLQQDHRTWSVVDWEVITQGKSEAAKWAGSQRAGQDWMAYPHQPFLENLAKADRCHSEGDLRGAIAAVTAADQLDLPSYVHKELQLAVGTRFYLYGQFQQAIDCLGTIHSPEEAPGVYVLRAVCYQALGEAPGVIDAAREYERLCGFAPDVARAKAWALAQLKKSEEAVAELKQLLEFDPGDETALEQLMQLLPAGKKGEIAQLVARAKDPPQTALAIVDNFQIRDDEETARAIKDLLESKYKDSPATHLFVGRVHQHEEEYDLAAAAFRRAYEAEKDPAQKTLRWHDYVAAMMSAGKLLAAYEESPDPVAVFAYLTEGLDDEEAIVSMKDLPALVEAHRRRAPQDPQVWICAGHIARDKGDLAAAEAEYAAGEAKVQDEELKSRLQFARMSVLADQGRILDAYRDYETRPDAFQFLANHCRFRHKPDVLEELLRRRKSTAADDEDLEYYRAVLEIERGQFPQALKRLLASADPKEDADEDGAALNLALRLRWLRVEVYDKYDQWQQALLQDPNFDEMWPQLAMRFWQTQQWQKLGELLVLAKGRPGGGGAQYLLYQMRLAWHLGQYEEFKSLVPNWDASVWNSLPPYEQKWARETLVRALLRAGDPNAAFSFAETFQREFEDELPLLLVRIAQGEAAQVKEIYSRVKPQIYYNLHQDAEMFPLLADSRFAEIRRENPFQLPGEHTRVSIVLFLREPLPLDVEKLRALSQDLETQGIVSLPAVDSSRQTYAITHAQGTILVTTGSSRYFPPVAEQDALRALRDSPIHAQVAGHQAWLAIDVLDSASALSRPQQDVFAKGLLRKLGDEKLLALGVVEDGGLMTFASASTAGMELRPEQSWQELVRNGPKAWWGQRTIRAGAESPPVNRRQMRTFTAAMAKLPAGQFAQIQVRLKLGHAEEEAWLKVVSVRKEEYVHTFTAEMQEASKLWPHLQAGEHCVVNTWQVRQTRLPE